MSDYWAIDRSKDLHSWLQHPTLLTFVSERVSGDPAVGTYLWFKQKYFPKPAEMCLILGCGFGQFERHAMAIGIAKRFHAHDISAGAIEKARQAAAEAGLAERIEYCITDLNRFTLPARTYDAVFIIMAAHHVVEIEDMFAQVRRAMKPGALLFLDEYIGPNRFQSAPLNVEIINRLLRVLPSRYRLSLFAQDGSTVDRYAPTPPEVIERADPSEAVRSADIVHALKGQFDIVALRPYGGSIQHMLYSGIMGNFDANDETDVALLRSIAIFEETLERTGVLESDFAAIVARPK